MGAQVAPRVAARRGRCLLELGGNNAAVVAPSTDLELTTRGIVFAAAGTAGQRCTTMRRVIVHEDVVDELIGRLRDVFGRLPIGDPSAGGDARRPAHQRAGVPRDGGRTRAGALRRRRADRRRWAPRGRWCAWRAYMRRATNTIKYSDELPLPQGVSFG
jgi:aldehyde dehydrogenase (NAD+)